MTPISEYWESSIATYDDFKDTRRYLGYSSKIDVQGKLHLGHFVRSKDSSERVGQLKFRMYWLLLNSCQQLLHLEAITMLNSSENLLLLAG